MPNGCSASDSVGLIFTRSYSSYVSDYDSDYDFVASENQPLVGMRRALAREANTQRKIGFGSLDSIKQSYSLHACEYFREGLSYLLCREVLRRLETGGLVTFQGNRNKL